MPNAVRVCLCLSVGFVSCEERIPSAPRQSPAFPEQQPVVAAPPVLTVPFEEGYKAGFDQGAKDGKPRMTLPNVADVRRMAEEAAGTDEQRNQKWRDGWADGYLDGFRQRATSAR
jgi:hypothetical protein